MFGLGTLRRLSSPLMSKLFPTQWKEFNELLYWKRRKKAEGLLSNDHYEYFYTEHFDRPKSFYDGKVILDIGCGPRGSLEWATNAKRRFGLDPLADEYKKLGADQHQMEYIASPSEKIPLEDGACDAIFSFNSLDHVEDVDATINEIKRCLSPTGAFYLIVEINHPPTACEPHLLTPQMLENAFLPEFEINDPKVYKAVVVGMYQSIKENVQFEDPMNCEEKGYFSVKFTRRKEVN